MTAPKKLYAIALGCPKNRVDTEIAISSILRNFPDVIMVNTPQEADLCLISTCAFIQSAVEESIETILETAASIHKETILIVIGCLVQRYGSELVNELPEVDLFIGNGLFSEVGVSLKKFIENPETEKLRLCPNNLWPQTHSASRPILTTPPWRSYLKIADGCSNKCTYCLIPKLRGPFKALPYSWIISHAKTLTERGIKEITFVAQDLGAYKSEGKDLSDLIYEVSRETLIPWIRLLYLNPRRVDERLLSTMASLPNICHYIDIPIQHASPKILKRMGRTYDSDHVLEIIEKARSILPDVAIRTTVMVGFPGETDHDFEFLLKFIKQCQFDHLGCFIYSNEDGIAATRFSSQVPNSLARERYDMIMTAQNEISLKRNKRWIGRTLEVLIEGSSPETDLLVIGRSRYQAPDIDGVVYINKGYCNPGELTRIRITDAGPYDLVGEVLT